MVKFSPKGDSKNKDNFQLNSNSKGNFKRNDDGSYTNTLFELAAKAVKDTKECKVGFKNVFNKMSLHKKFMKPVFGIGCKVMSNWKTNEEILKSSGIFTEHPNIDKNLLRVVVAELLWGRKNISGEGEVFDIVREKKEILTDLLKEHEEDKKEDEIQVFFARVNSLKISVRVALTHLDELGYKLVETPSKYKTYLQEIVKLEPNSFMIDFHFKDLFAFNVKAKALLIPNAIVQDKLIIVQNKSSLIPVHLMDVKPGNTVLDMCAAPGMKTAIIASQLKGEGTVWAVDKDKSRFSSMIKNLDGFGAQKITHSVNCDVLHLMSGTKEFDVILLDAPCSGSGIAGRLGDTDGNPMRLRKLQWIQMKLLMQALTKYPTAKRVVYSTCSIYPDENEGVIDEVMKKLKDELTYKLVDCHKLISGFSKGSKDYNCGSSCIRISVEDDFTNGFFIAVFEKDLTKIKTEDSESAKRTKAGNKRKHPEVKEELTSEEENVEEDAENTEEDDSDEEEEIPQPQTLVRQKKGGKAKQTEISPKKMKLQNEKSSKTIVQNKNKMKPFEIKEEVKDEVASDEVEEEDNSFEEIINKPIVKPKKIKQKIQKETTQSKVTSKKPKRKQKKNAAKKTNAVTPEKHNVAKPKKSKRKNKKSI